VSTVERTKALDRLEARLVQASLANPGALPPDREAALRWAISLARVERLRGVSVDEPLQRFRGEVNQTLASVIRAQQVDLEAAAVLAPALGSRAWVVREELLRMPGVDPDALDKEVREKRLVLALGGGGGTAWVHLGALSLLEEAGIRPGLIAASSMGSVLGLFRARSLPYDQGEVLQVARGLSFGKVFRAFSPEGSRYGLPAALRLHLRGALAPHLRREDGGPFTFRDLAIPTVVAISGIRKDALPRPLSYYEDLLPGGAPRWPLTTPRRLGPWVEAMVELTKRGGLIPIRVGGSNWTADLDPVDMVGFSCAVPGLIHYDVLRSDPNEERLQRLLATRGAAWLVDGGLTDNVPAAAAWEAVQEGAIGTKNALILALDGFSPRLSSALWLPLQRIAVENVRRSLEYADAVVSYSRTLSPTDILPSIGGLIRAIDLGRSQLAHQMPLIRKLTSPLPPLQAVAPGPVKRAISS
jgi:predicted acylesterase/phospholipase RssA